MAVIKIPEVVDGVMPVANFVCPGCGRLASFVRLGRDLKWSRANFPGAGWRQCPSCFAITAVIWSAPQEFAVYPTAPYPVRVEGVPEAVKSALEEAALCFSQHCFAACAIMTRKVVELVCNDLGATGSNLHQKLRALGSKMTLSTELLAAADGLRLLGNDAAHITASAYSNVGKDECDIALEFVSEILEAAYQHKELLAKLTALRNAPQHRS